MIILSAYEFILEYEWVKSSILAESLRSVGVKDLANFSSTLKKFPQYFRTKGSTIGKEYKLTSTDGRRTAFETITKLAKGEKLE